jgi:sugar phosphate isomerase/epimerase
MRLAYNTNGFPQHRLADVCRILAELGYDGISITPDVLQLDPFGRDVQREANELRTLVDDLGLSVAVETGARFLLDARRKHQPTLLSEPKGRQQRLDGLLRCLELAELLGAETFSFWAGTFGDEGVATPPREELLDRLCAGAASLLEEGRSGSVRVCFEPEPGMLVASLAELGEFLGRLNDDSLAVMLDVGHVPVTEDVTPAQALRQLAPRLGGLQLDDSRDRRHEHLLPGEGEIDWPAVMAAAREVGFTGLASLELPRHGHDPVRTARTALAFFRQLEPGAR